jgi:DNA-binding CsgD family transcriptional regulator
VVEIREVLRGWLDGGGLRTIAERAGVDRKTARRYVQAAQAAGLVRDAGPAALGDALIGAVVEQVRPARPNGHGAAWESLTVRRAEIAGWVKGGKTLVKIEDLLARSGTVVPYRTLHRFATAECGFRPRRSTVRVLDGDPGVECQIDFAHGVHPRRGDRAAAEGARADPDRGVLAAHVRALDVRADPG